MTYKQQLASNKKLINLYVNSIKNEDLTNKQCAKVAYEIARLKHQNDYIEDLQIKELGKHFSVADIEIPSIINAHTTY